MIIAGLINFIITALLLATIVSIPLFWLERRRFRGLGISDASPACGKCLYPMRGWGSPVCPECGSSTLKVGVITGSTKARRLALCFVTCGAVFLFGTGMVMAQMTLTIRTTVIDQVWTSSEFAWLSSNLEWRQRHGPFGAVERPVARLTVSASGGQSSPEERATRVVEWTDPTMSPTHEAVVKAIEDVAGDRIDASATRKHATAMLNGLKPTMRGARSPSGGSQPHTFAPWSGGGNFSVEASRHWIASLVWLPLILGVVGVIVVRRKISTGRRAVREQDWGGAKS